MKRDAAGFSIVELVIALGLTATMLAVVFSALTPAGGMFASGGEAADVQQRLRAAADAISRDLLNAGKSVRVQYKLDAEIRTSGVTSASVLGTLPGVSDEKVIIVAHMDGYFEAALDNASGLSMMIAMAERGEGDWKPPIVMTTATTGEGIADLTAALDAHWSWLDSSGERDRRRRARAREEVAAIAVATLRQRMGGLPGDSRLDELAARVAAGELDPYSAAAEIMGAIENHKSQIANRK